MGSIIMTLQQKKLGSTDLVVSVLGLGTVKLGRNTDVKYPTSFEIPDDKQAANLLSLAKDLNINLLDTAPAYGNSEERLGKLLRNQRHDWVLASKAGENYHNNKSSYDFAPESIIKSIHTSLKNLNTDYLDIVLIHSDGNDEEIIQKYNVFETMRSAKKQGLIRYFGMSTKTVAGGLLTLENSDIAMVTHNPEYTDELEVIEYAAKHNKGIFIKKAFASGKLTHNTGANAVQEAMNFVLREPGVSSIILGTINPEHLKQNVQCAINAS
jgi:aryl-alcohol dehydrogenase-like predicted oxidoreductase